MLKRFWIFIINPNKARLLAWLMVLLLVPCKSMALFEKVFSAKTKLILNQDSYLKIDSSFPEGCFDDIGLVSRADCFPSNRLVLIERGYEYDYSKLIKSWSKYIFIYFVKLSPNGHINDLDHDGHPEVAIYPMLAGNHPVTDAYIYSIRDNKLIRYGVGRFNFEKGPYVKNIIKVR